MIVVRRCRSESQAIGSGGMWKNAGYVVMKRPPIDGGTAKSAAWMASYAAREYEMIQARDGVRADASLRRKLAHADPEGSARHFALCPVQIC